MSKPVKIGLVGFGRIGRNLYRIGYNNPNYQFVAISDLGEPEALHYLLMRDSVHGPMGEEARLEDNHLILGPQKSRILKGGNPGRTRPCIQGIRLSTSEGVPPPKRIGSPLRGSKAHCISAGRMGVVT